MGGREGEGFQGSIVVESSSMSSLERLIKELRAEVVMRQPGDKEGRRLRCAARVRRSCGERAI